MGFKDKQIVVNDTSSGFGQQTARLLTEAGAYVIGLEVRDASEGCAQCKRPISTIA